MDINLDELQDPRIAITRVELGLETNPRTGAISQVITAHYRIDAQSSEHAGSDQDGHKFRNVTKEISRGKLSWPIDHTDNIEITNALYALKKACHLQLSNLFSLDPDEELDEKE